MRPIPVQDVWEQILLTAKIHDNADLEFVAHLAKLDDVVGDEAIAIPALSSLPAWGVSGLHILKELTLDCLHSCDALKIFLTCASGSSISITEPSFLPDDWFLKCGIDIKPNLQEEAQKIIRKFMLDQTTDSKLRSLLISNLWMNMSFFSKGQEYSPDVEYFFSEFTDSRLVINQQLINEFEKMVNSPDEREETIQKFLFENPIFIDPLAIEIRSKHELGNEFKTDFVIKRLNDEYVLVEIEKTTDKIFTQKGVFHSQLTEATAQVRDFQAWIHDNIAYARNTLPGIRRPEGILVIGRQSMLDEQMTKRLDEENFSRRGHIKIITYDDLLNQGKTMYSNMISRPVRFKGKKQV